MCRRLQNGVVTPKPNSMSNITNSNRQCGLVRGEREPTKRTSQNAKTGKLQLEARESWYTHFKHDRRPLCRPAKIPTRTGTCLRCRYSFRRIKLLVQSALSKHTRFVEAKNDLNCVLREDVSLWRYSGRYCVWTKFVQLERCVFTE